MDGVVEMILAFAGAFGGLSALKFLFFMKPESRKAKAEADIKEIEADEKEMGVMKSLVESLRNRIEQQDAKIKILNDKVDYLYREKHKLEEENNRLVKENAILKINMAEISKNICMRPDDECQRRKPPRNNFRLVRFAKGYYDNEPGEAERFFDYEDNNKEERRKHNKDADNGVSEETDRN
jgi:hypothetical protein